MNTEQPSEQPAFSFEEGLAQLEALTLRMERETLPVGEAMRLYAEGMRLSQQLGRILDGHERQLDVLSNPDAYAEEPEASTDMTDMTVVPPSSAKALPLQGEPKRKRAAKPKAASQTVLDLMSVLNPAPEDEPPPDGVAP